MLNLQEGSYTGKVMNKIYTDNFIVTTTLYLKSNCEDRLHSHDNATISFLYQGADVESRKNANKYKRKAGDIFFYDSGEPHKTVLTLETSKNVNIELRNSRFLKDNCSNTNLQKLISNDIDANLIAVKILKEINIADDYSSMALESLCLDLTGMSNRIQSNIKPTWVNVLETFLDDNWQNKYSLTELSEISGVHPITISKNFRKYFLCSLGEYVRKIKIRKSIPLIKNSEMSLTEIAYTCGFADQSHFIRNFKAYTGYLPKDFQKI